MLYNMILPENKLVCSVLLELFCDGGDDEVTEDFVGFIAFVLLLIKANLPLGTLLFVCKDNFGLCYRFLEYGVTCLLFVGNLPFVLV